MPSCCYWLLYRWWLGRPLVFRCLLDKADTKPQRRRRLTTQQHTQRPVTTPRLHSGFTVKPPRIQIITPQLVLLPELHYQSAEYYTEAPKYYTTEAPTETTQLRMLPQPTTPRLQLITPLKLSNTTLERPSTIEVSQVSFSDTQHGSPEVSNNLCFKQWNDKEWGWALYYCNFFGTFTNDLFSFLVCFSDEFTAIPSNRIAKITVA
jgi:hypothetical protein